MGKTQERKFDMSYNGNNNRRNFNNNRNNNNRNFNNRNNNRNINQQNAKKQEIIEKQKKNLDMIEAVAEYLNNIIAAPKTDENNSAQKITMKEILNYLVNDKGFAQDDTKAVSQFNYIMMDLANAQKSGFINGNRINIRILYIQERLKTSFKKELHPVIDNIMENYSNLFLWNEDDKSENSPIEVVPTDEGTPLTPTAEETIQSNEEVTVEEKGNNESITTNNINIEIPSTTTDVKSIDTVTTEETVSE